jgi:FKBP-type peptidyl-prolyl cis-trans isomerase
MDWPFRGNAPAPPKVEKPVEQMITRMKRYLLAFLGLGLAINLWAADNAPQLNTPKEKMSYGLGVDIGRSLTNRQVEVNADALTAGLKAVLTGTKPLLSDQEVQEALNAFRAEMQAKMSERMRQQQETAKTQGEKSKKEGEAFLAENKKKEGVIALPSGLQYKVYTAGTGRKPSSTDTVVTHYRGTLTDGKEFDSSYRNGEPVTFPVNRVIKGWQEALQLMPVGSKWKVFIPSDLAYGERGSPPKIPPHSVLVFDLELLGIADPASTNKVDKAK